jgi:hypothetical protein
VRSGDLVSQLVGQGQPVGEIKVTDHKEGGDMNLGQAR